MFLVTSHYWSPVSFTFHWVLGECEVVHSSFCYSWAPPWSHICVGHFLTQLRVQLVCPSQDSFFPLEERVWGEPVQSWGLQFYLIFWCPRRHCFKGVDLRKNTSIRESIFSYCDNFVSWWKGLFLKLLVEKVLARLRGRGRRAPFCNCDRSSFRHNELKHCSDSLKSISWSKLW